MKKIGRIDVCPLLFLSTAFLLTNGCLLFFIKPSVMGWTLFFRIYQHGERCLLSTSFAKVRNKEKKILKTIKGPSTL